MSEMPVPIIQAAKVQQISNRREHEIAKFSESLYRQWQTEALNELMHNYRDTLRFATLSVTRQDDIVTERIFFSVLLEHAESGTTDIETYIEKLINSPALSLEMKTEAEKLKIEFIKAVQKKADTKSVEVAQELAKLGILNACMISGEGSSIWNWVLVQLGKGNTNVYGDRGNLKIGDAVVHAQNHPGRKNNCKGKPELKLDPGQEIIVANGEIIVVDEYGKKIRELKSNYTPDIPK